MEAASESLRLAMIAAEMYSYEINIETGRVSVSDNFAEVVGFSIDPALDDEDWRDIASRLHPPEDVAALLEAVQKSIHTGSDFRLEYRMIHPRTKEEVWLESYGTAVERPGSKLPRIVGMTWNVTRRKRVEEKLRQSEARQTFLLDLSDCLRHSTDADGILSVASEALARRLGVASVGYCVLEPDSRSAVVIGGYWDGRIPSMAGCRLCCENYGPDFLPTLVSGKEIYFDDVRTTIAALPPGSAEGQFISFASGAAIPLIRGGQLVAYLYVMHPAPHVWDEEDRRLLHEVAERTWSAAKRARAEEALRESEERFRAIVSQTTVGVACADLDSRLTIVNRKLAEMLGYEESELAGKTVEELTHPDHVDENARMLERMAADGIPFQLDKRLVRKDGSTLWVSVTVSMLQGPTGKPQSSIAVIIDITERKRAETERQELLGRERAARAEAEQANRLKDEFLATLSHELRTPLSNIVGYAQILMLKPESAAHSKSIAESIYRNALTQAELIKDLLDLSRLKTGKLALNRNSIDLSLVVNDAVDSVRSEASARKIALDLNVTSEPLMARADTTRVQQIVWNLLTNAIKFTADGGSVLLTLNRDQGMAMLTVEDTGQGIDPEFLPHVFEMFRQADARTTRRHGGLGIGLGLVQQLVNLHGGRVEVHSEGVGKGARFTVWLPLEAVPVESMLRRGASLSTCAVGRLTGMRILVVDDMPDTVEALSGMLEVEGASISAATDGARALRLAEAQEFDVILSDISMPEMDGYELLHELRKRKGAARTPAIALTGLGRAEDIEMARSAGFSAHLIKPIPLDQLVAAICAAVQNGI